MNQWNRQIEKIKKSGSCVDLSASLNFLASDSLSLLLDQGIDLLDPGVFEFPGRVKG